MSTQEVERSPASAAMPKNGVFPLALPARELKPTMLAAIPLLLEGLTSREVALKVGVHEGTLGDWVLRNEAFIEEYERQRIQLYNSDLQCARTRLRSHLDEPEIKHQQGAAKILMEHHAQMARANSTVTHTVILDKLQAALAGREPDAIEAEWTALAEGTEQPKLVDALPSDTTE